MAKAKKLQSGSWNCVVFDYKDENGKRHYQSFTADTKNECEYLADQYLLQKKYGLSQKNTLRSAITKYIEFSKTTLSPTTLQRYEQVRDFNFQTIMDIDPRKLTQEDIDKAIKHELTTPSARTGKPLAESTIRNSWGVIRSALNKYYPYIHFVTKFPAKEKKIIHLPEPIDIMKAVKGTEVELPVLLAMWLSFSMSEIQGLKWGSIHGDKISVEQVVVTVRGEFVEKSKAKAYERKRTHKLPKEIKDIIDAMPKGKPTDKLVRQNSRQLYKQFERILAAKGIEHITFHQLRHENASIMAMLNIPLNYAKERGGWATDYTITQTYTHTFDSHRVEVDETVDKYMSELYKKA